MAEKSAGPTLTPRQCKVLGLLAGGRTNGEIAHALGITLDGAKWHVTELMNRFGVSSREELVEMWESRQKGPARWLRGLLGLSAGGSAAKAAVAVATVVLAGGGIALLSTGQSDVHAPHVQPIESSGNAGDNWFVDIDLASALQRDDGMRIGAAIPALPSDVVDSNGPQRLIQYTSAGGSQLVTFVFTGPMPDGDLVMWLDPWTRVDAFDHSGYYTGQTPDDAGRWFVRFRRTGAMPSGTIRIEALGNGGTAAPTPSNLLRSQ